MTGGDWMTIPRLSPALLAFAMLVACSAPESETQAVQNQHAAIAAKLLVLHVVQQPDYYITSGVVSSDHRVAISSRISGYVHAIAAREGDRVKLGQILVRVDPVNAKQALNRALADFADARTDMERYRKLLAGQAVSKQQFDKVRLRFKVAKSRVEQARNQLNYAEIASPVTGIVVKKAMNTGDMASPGVPILVVEDPMQLLVEADVSARAVAALHIGDAVNVVIPALQTTRSGHIRQLVNAADPVSHQFHVKIALDSIKNVHPGMFAEVRFRTGARKALLIPQAAVIHRSGLDGIYAVDAKGVLHYRQVRLGERHGEMVEIAAGLEGGDVLALAADTPLSTGMRVKAANTAGTSANTTRGK